MSDPLAEPLDLNLPAPERVAESWLAEIRRLGSPRKLRDEMRGRYPAIADIGAITRLAVVGAAGEGVRLAECACALGAAVEAIADDRAELQGTAVAGTTVVPVDGLAQLERSVPVVVASHRPLRLPQRLRDMGFDTVLPFFVLQVLAPEHFPPHMFYDGWFEDLAENVDRYAELSEMLGDDDSRQHLDAVLGYRLTGDLGAIAGIIDWNVYHPLGLFDFREDEVYVDGGAFDGDSIRLFAKRVGGRFDRAIGFEPDPSTYNRLATNFADEDRIEAVQKGLFSRTDVLRFNNDGSRGALLTAEGTVEIPVIGLDDYLNGDRVTFIKMNIEGAEIDALRGASASIRKWRPRLAISAYHRPSDLWAVPFLIRELRSDYVLALRQHDAGTIETVAYGL